MNVGAAACPDAPGNNARAVKIDAATDGTEQRLPLEGKLAQRQLRLMRSKLKIITMGWYDAVTFDLIRHGLRPVTPSPPGEGFFSVPSVSASIFTTQVSKFSGRGMPPPLH